MRDVVDRCVLDHPAARPSRVRALLRACLTAGLLCVPLAFLAGCGGGGGGGGGGGDGGVLAGRLVLPGQGGFAARALDAAPLAEQEPNDGAIGVPHLGRLEPGARIVLRGHVDATSDAFDGVRVELPARATLRVTLMIDPARDNDCDVALIDPTTGRTLAFAPSVEGQVEVACVAKGLCDVVVRPVAGAGGYVLSLAVEALPEVVPVAGAQTPLGEVLPGDRLELAGHGPTSFEVATPLATRLALESAAALPVMLGRAGEVLLPGESALLEAPAASAVRIGVTVEPGTPWRLTVLGVAAGERPGAARLLGLALPLAPESPLWRRAADVGWFHAAGRLRVGEALVRAREGASREAEEVVLASGGRVLEAIPEGGAMRIAFDLDIAVDEAPYSEALRAEATLRRTLALSRASALAYAEPNHRRRAYATTPNDPRYRDQWHYPLMRLPEAWDVTTGSASVIVAIIDTGITAHPDLAGKSVAGYDFIADVANGNDGDARDSDPTDPGDAADGYPASWHGTHVAGTVGAATNNGAGVAGVTWGCKLMNLRVLGPDGGDDFDIANAVLYAAGLANVSGRLPAQRANVINMSLGGGDSNATFADACSRARTAGVVVVAAAGNESTSSRSYPAAFDGVVAVGAVDRAKALASYSNFGSWVDCVAPGGDSSASASSGVLSTLPNETGTSYGYEYYDGTSMASPHAAGVAALVFSLDTSFTAAQVENILLSTAQDLGAAGRDTTFGNGLLDAYAAVVAALDGGSVPPPPPPPPAPTPDPDPDPTPVDAPIWVLAVDASSDETVAEAEVRPGEGLAFELHDVPAGTYYLVAGTDRDDDGYIGDEGDLFGGYPDPEDWLPIDLGLGASRYGLDVVLATVGAGGFGAGGSGGAGGTQPRRVQRLGR